MTAVLMVLSAARHWTLKDGTLHPTAVWAEEFAVPTNCSSMPASTSRSRHPGAGSR